MHVVSLEAATDVIKSLSIFLVIFWFLQKISLRREFNRQLGEYCLLHVFFCRGFMISLKTARESKQVRTRLERELIEGTVM